MREITPPTAQYFGYEISSQTCPSCRTTMLRGPVACPDGKVGCCVAHYGWVCPNCHKQFA